MKNILFTILIFSLNSFAERYPEREREVLLTPKDPKTLRSKEVNQLPEIYNFSDSILQERDTDTGMYSETYYTGNDQSRFSASIGFSQDYEDPSKVYTIDMVYLNKFDIDYEELWWGLQLQRTTAKHSAISEETTATNGLARADNQQFFTILGLGVGHRFKTLTEVFDTDRIFETINVYMNYVFHLDNTDTKQYTGYGYTAEYGLHYRSSHRLFYGTKLSYNWVNVERAADADESLLSRSLTFGWLNVGFEIGYYF